METPTLQTEIHGHDFTITGDALAVAEAAERLVAQQRREYASYVLRHVVTAPIKAVGVLATGIGTALVDNAKDVWEDYTLHNYDQRNHTDLYERKQRQLREARTKALVERIGL